MTPFQLHRERWYTGCGSDQCEAARHIVLARGVIPCDVLFIGEAPGESEDVVGQPFIGPAGKLLDDIINRSKPGKLRIAWSNVVACIPRVAVLVKASEPSKEQIESCRPRLREMIELAKPRQIVAVGEIADKYVPHAMKGMEIPIVKIIHPAAIIRKHISEQGLIMHRVVIQLATLFHELNQQLIPV